MRNEPMTAETSKGQWFLNLLARTRMAEASVFAYCLWQARNLFSAWQRSPHERFGWIALLIWALPILYKRSDLSPCQNDSFPPLLALGLFFSFIGDVGSLNALKNLGLAMALAGLVPVSPCHLLWTVTAISWMPLFGWVGSRWFPQVTLPARLMIAMAGSGLYLLRLEPRPGRSRCRT